MYQCIRQGGRADPLKPILQTLVAKRASLAACYRAEAAYALAALEPQNAEWRTTLEQLAEDDVTSLLQDRIEALDPIVK